MKRTPPNQAILTQNNKVDEGKIILYDLKSAPKVKGMVSVKVKGGNTMFEGIFQPMHLIIILVIVLIIFGPGKLPELGSSIGKAIRGFKKAMNEPEKKSEEETKKIENKDKE